MKKQVEIVVLGQKFMVRSDSDESYVQQVGQYVDQKMNEVLKNTRSVASLNVAILAAMNIADEFFKWKNTVGKQNQDMTEKVRNMIELIDLQL